MEFPPRISRLSLARRYVSSGVFVIYQLIVSYPTEFIATIPMIALLAQVCYGIPIHRINTVACYVAC